MPPFARILSFILAAALAGFVVASVLKAASAGHAPTVAEGRR